MKTFSKTDISEIAAMLRNMPIVSAVQLENNQLLAKLKNNDRDLVLVLIKEVDQERLVCNISLDIPADKYADSLLITNSWNRITDSNDTYAYVAAIADRLFIRLESYCLLMGGIDRKSIGAWIQNLVEHIHPFEAVMLSRLSST